jgi:hypothetical protein
LIGAGLYQIWTTPLLAVGAQSLLFLKYLRVSTEACVSGLFIEAVT